MFSSIFFDKKRQECLSHDPIYLISKFPSRNKSRSKLVCSGLFIWPIITGSPDQRSAGDSATDSPNSLARRWLLSVFRRWSDSEKATRTTAKLTALWISWDQRLSTPSLVLYPLSTLCRRCDLVSSVTWPLASKGARRVRPPLALSCFAACLSKYLKMCVRPRMHSWNRQ